QNGGSITCPSPITSTKRCYPGYTTSYTWDNFGRLKDITIPATSFGSVSTPQETIRYGYDGGGAVASARGIAVGNSTPFEYVTHVGYNEFGERVYIKYGNQAYSQYSYHPETRRLAIASTTVQDTPGQPARQVQSAHFYYDMLGNVIGREQPLGLDMNP